METLSAILKASPPSPLVKPEMIRAEDIQGPAHWYLTGIERTVAANERTRKVVSEQEQYGIKIASDKVFLFAINPDCRIVGRDEEPDYGMLVHLGLFINGTDNIQNLLQYGVFGDKEVNHPTYLMRPNSGIVPLGWGTGKRRSVENQVTLFIDKQKLLERRSVFIDPETIEMPIIHQMPKEMMRAEVHPSFLGNRRGDSYFVLGGIPQEAIIEYRSTIEGDVKVL